MKMASHTDSLLDRVRFISVMIIERFRDSIYDNSKNAIRFFKFMYSWDYATAAAQERAKGRLNLYMHGGPAKSKGNFHGCSAERG
jgi:hypothetical protein